MCVGSLITQIFTGLSPHAVIQTKDEVIDMKDELWNFFKQTGLPQAWLLYKKYEEREERDRRP